MLDAYFELVILSFIDVTRHMPGWRMFVFCVKSTSVICSVKFALTVAYHPPRIVPRDSASKFCLGGIVWVCDIIIYWCNKLLGEDIP